MFRILYALIALLILPTAVMADGPSRLTVAREVTLNAPADMVWDLISDFCSIAEWHPLVAECEGKGGNEPGATRVLEIGEPGGPRIHEELQKFDVDKMTYQYKITQTDNAVLPVTTYSADLSVSDIGDGASKVQWRGSFYRAYPNNDPPPELNDEAAVAAVAGVYEAGLEGIKEMIEN